MGAMLQRAVRTSIEGVLPPDLMVGGDGALNPLVHDDRFYRAVALHGSLGLGEAYMNGWWDCRSIDRFMEGLLRAGFLERSRYSPETILMRMRQRLFNEQKASRAREIAERHYDLGNDLFESFLDPYNQYTCGYFKDTTSLNVAQERKLDLICRKLELRPTDKVLDIGCGWGGFAKYASGHFGCRVTGVSISDEQVRYARAYCSGLPVDIRNCDYRSLNESFDKILICGMIEHVGFKNYRTIMKVVGRCLDPRGLFLLHTIGKGSDDVPVPEPWILKYIFPGGMLPTPRRIARATEGVFDLVDLHEFGEYYDPTLMAWAENFEKNWPKIQDRYDERFRRMWRYYLLSCAALFRVRKINLWHFVFRPRGGPGYVSIR